MRPIIAIVAALSLGAVTSTESRVEYTGNGTTAAFAFAFPVHAAAHVEVFLGGVKQASGFTVTLAANQATSPGGSVTFAAAPAAGVVVRIQRTVPLKQETVWQPYSAFSAKTLERALDGLAMQTQQLDRDKGALGGRRCATGEVLTSTDGATLTCVPDNGSSPVADLSTVTVAGSSTARALREVIQPMPVPASLDLVIAGDSICNFVPAQRWSDILPNLSQFKGRVVNNRNTCVSGRKIADITAGYAAEVYPHRPAVAGRPVYLFVAVGTNDLEDGGGGAAAAFTALQSYWAQAKADGFTVVAFTVLRVGTTATAAFSTNEIDSFNAKIRAATGYDLLVDQNLVLADPYDSNLFNADRVHPIAAGHVLLAAYVNEAFGGPAAPLGARFTGRRTGYSHSCDVTGLGISTGQFNLACGSRSLRSNTSGQHNTGVGSLTLDLSSTGSHNTAVGSSALRLATGADKNTALGALTLSAGVPGNENTAVGYNALNAFTGANTTAVGSLALGLNVSGTGNTAVGYAAAYRTTGNQNTAVGTAALTTNTSGADNTAVGFQAMTAATGGANTAVGSLSLAALTTTGNNTGVGNRALGATTAGASNTAVGSLALYGNTTGSTNTALGLAAGRFQADGTTPLNPNNSVYLGANTRGLNNGDSNAIVIGHGAVGEGANTTVIGTPATTATHLFGAAIVEMGGSAAKAICWKGDGKTLGYCSTAVDATGACTCN